MVKYMAYKIFCSGGLKQNKRSVVGYEKNAQNPNRSASE